MQTFELSDGTLCTVIFLFNGLCGELTVARVCLADGSTLAGSQLRRDDYLDLLRQQRESDYGHVNSLPGGDSA
jgi:hypothetical protein